MSVGWNIVIALTLLLPEQSIGTEGAVCNKSLLWFQVDSRVFKASANIVLSDLISVADIDGNGMPNEVFAGTLSQSPYGCIDEGSFACTLGYRYTPNNPTTNQVERVLISGTCYWRPIAAQVTFFQSITHRAKVR